MRMAAFAMIVTMLRQPERAVNALCQQCQTDGNHKRAGDETENGKEPLGDNILRGAERDNAKRKHAGGMCDRDREAEKERMFGAAARAHQISAHHGFAMPGRERME